MTEVSKCIRCYKEARREAMENIAALLLRHPKFLVRLLKRVEDELLSSKTQTNALDSEKKFIK